jgi:uncharacterized protein DUF397
MGLSAKWAKSSRNHTNGCVECRLVWRTATASGSHDCVEVAYRKATASGSNGCVEVATDPACGQVLVRDSKLGDASPVLGFTLRQWTVLLLMAGQFHVDWFPWQAWFPGLEFNQAEREAFIDGARRGEFDLSAEAVPA